MTFNLAFDLQGPDIVNDIRGTGYRPEITPACVPKWSQKITSLPEHLTQACIRPGIRPSRSKSTSKNGVPDIVPKLRQHAYQNSLKLWLTSRQLTHSFGLAFDLQGQIQGQRPGCMISSQMTSARLLKWFQATASLPGQLTQP